MTCDGGLWSLRGDEKRSRTRRFVQRNRGEPIGPGASYARHPQLTAFAVPKFPAPCPLLDLYSVISNSTEIGEARARGTRASSYGEYTRLFSGRDQVREHEATLRLGKSVAMRAKLTAVLGSLVSCPLRPQTTSSERRVLRAV